MTLVAQSPDGEFRQRALNSTFIAEPGDTAITTGSTVTFLRNGVVVGVRRLVGPETVVPLGASEQQIISKAIYFWRKPVVGIVATLINVVKNTTSGSIRFVFSNGNEREFTGAAQALETTNYLDTDSVMAEDILIRKTLVNSPDETNLTTCIGGKCSVDMNANNPVTLTIE